MELAFLKLVHVLCFAAMCGVPLQSVSACPPPPPGDAAPTHQQLLARSLSEATDIAYGVYAELPGE